MRASPRPRWALLLASCTLLACQDRGTPPAVPAAAPASTPASAPTTHRVTLSAPGLSVALETAAAPDADGVLRVRAIEIRRDGAPAQRIEGLDTRTPWTPEAPGAQLLDMNFDGQLDLRLIEARPAGPDLPYLNWLYEPASGRYVASPALDAIASPRFDAAARLLHADWRDGATRYGTDTFVFREGQPVPVRREARTYTRPGAYTLQVSSWVNGAWQVVETREGREP